MTNLGNLKPDASVISRFDDRYVPADNRTAVREAHDSRATWSYAAANQLLGEYRTGGDRCFDPIVSRGESR